MTRIAYSLVNEELIEKLGTLVASGAHWGNGIYQIKIQSDLIAPKDDGAQVEIIIDPTVEGGFRFRREDYGLET